MLDDDKREALEDLAKALRKCKAAGINAVEHSNVHMFDDKVYVAHYREESGVWVESSSCDAEGYFGYET